MSNPALLPWNNGAHRRLWSLEDLIECRIVFLVQAIQQLQATIDSLYRYPNMRADMLQQEKERVASNAGIVWIIAHKELLDNDDLNAKLWRLDSDLRGSQGMCAETLVREVEQIRDIVLWTLSRKQFAFIPDELKDYFENDYLFGGWVHQKFPEIRDDIKESGNCVAADLPTAAVFHLMRIAEFGFRHAAKRAKVRLTDNKKRLPVDFAGWEKIVQGLDQVVKANRQSPKGPARERKATLYASLVEQCGYFRDVYRDKTMHQRKRYNHPEAVGAFLRVKEFITLLAGPPK